MLGDSVESAFTSSKLGTLNRYIAKFNKKTPGRPISLIGIFTERYGDDAVVKALVSAEKNVDSSPEVAKQLRAEQHSAWLDSDKSVDDVFKQLKIADEYEGPTRLDLPKLKLLDDYVAKFNRERDGHETFLDTLKRGFGGESKFVSLLARAKDDARTVNMAKELERGLLEQWEQEKLGPARVMKRLLQLDNDADQALSSSRLETFDKYITQFNKNDPDSEVTLVGMLTSKYGEIDVAVAKRV
ncbi:hypothetical protein PI124_g5703 [Phytophthora idaei]|nr:hypothetical protein PI125_g7400 [Phytophthora idaei]KAG3249619.1 hypothetical protein PI124_g5703 [Phytophthora idaei]